MEGRCRLASASCRFAQSPLCPGVCPGLRLCSGRAGAVTLVSPSVPQDNLKIPGSVTSRINLWISRTQEPAKEEKSKVLACADTSG